MNDIYLRRRFKLHVRPGDGGATRAQLAAVQQEAAALGFVLDDDLAERVLSLSTKSLAVFRSDLLSSLRALLGAHRTHQPLYPNFPFDVLAASDAELYLNAIRHYLDGRRPEAAADAPKRPPLLDGRAPRTIRLGSIEDFERIFTALAGAKTSLSQQDKDDVAWFVRQYREGIHRLLPAALPFKENAAVVGALLFLHAGGEATDAFLRQQLKTPTDMLRWLVGLNGGDVALATPTKFKSMPRATRRFVLSMLEAMRDPTEDMLRWPEPWKRLGERLHPGEHAARYPKTVAAFDVLRKGLPFETFNSRVERGLAAGATDAALDTLLARPGELARRLDTLLRKSATPDAICHAFARVAGGVSTPVLLQVLSHFRHRVEPAALRSFFPKGDAARVFAMKDERTPVSREACEAVVSTCESTLIARFAALSPLGRCHVDARLGTYLVPLAQRAASKALRTLVRGSRLPMPAAPVARLFLWWRNGRGRTDIDLSAAFYGERFDYLGSVTYYNLKEWGGYHSGDITDAPNGAAEFIDLDIDKLRARGVRFVVTCLNSFTSQPYCDLPECFAGWMARRDAGSGEPFEPRTVEDRVDIASDSQVCIPFALDLQAREVLWMDVGLTRGVGFNNLRNNLSGVSLVLRALSAMRKPDLRTLFTLHARARGQLVDDASEADTLFSPDAGITPFDVDRIRSEFL